jgi:hypothetical protein
MQRTVAAISNKTAGEVWRSTQTCGTFRLRSNMYTQHQKRQKTYGGRQTPVTDSYEFFPGEKPTPSSSHPHTPTTLSHIELEKNQQVQAVGLRSCSSSRLSWESHISGKIDDLMISGVTRVEYRPGANPEDSLCFRHYNPSERVHGRTMEEWIRPAVSFWHAFCYQGVDRYGMPAFIRPWDEAPNSLEACKRRVRAAFEFYSKLGECEIPQDMSKRCSPSN